MTRSRASLPAATVMLYALGYPLGAMTLHHLSPFLLILVRFVLQAALMWVVVLARGITVPRGPLLRWSLASGVLVQGVQFLGLYWGMAHGVAPGVAALVIATNPVATSLLGRLLFRRRENAWGLVALALGTVGVVAACVPRLLTDASTGPGLVAVLAALAGLALGSLVQGRRVGAVHPVAFTAVGVTGSIPFAAMLAVSEPKRIEGLVGAVPLLVLLVVDSAAAMVCYATCVRRLGARGASGLFALVPTAAVLAGFLLLGSPVGGWTAVGLTAGALSCLAQARSGRTGGRWAPAIPARQRWVPRAAQGDVPR